tara:strand:- start:2241 stop:2453 length:213 start_codon:yes stop_codon:yes gene_type:complete
MSKELINKDKIRQYAYDILHDHIDECFLELHDKFPTAAGDITPRQTMLIDQSVDKLSDVMAEQVYQNLRL